MPRAANCWRAAATSCRATGATTTATQAAIDADGWLHTGDIAEIRGGKIYIRGRVKDILVMSNGEKLPPQDVEFAILRDPVFEQVMLVGEGRPFLTLLAVTKERDEKLLIARANEQLKAFPRWVRVRRVIATPEPWSIDNGLLTPTLKLKRPLVLAKFKGAVDAVYGAEIAAGARPGAAGRHDAPPRRRGAGLTAGNRRRSMARIQTNV